MLYPLTQTRGDHTVEKRVLAVSQHPLVSRRVTGITWGHFNYPFCLLQLVKRQADSQSTAPESRTDYTEQNNKTKTVIINIDLFTRVHNSHAAFLSIITLTGAHDSARCDQR